MESGILGWLKVVVIVSLFYAFSITLIVHYLPSDTLGYAQSFESSGNTFTDISAKTEESLTRQTNIPIIDVGALVFYSGNIVLDLLLNFLTAIPQMIMFLLIGFAYLVNIDSFITFYVQVLIEVALTVLYFIGIIQMLLTIRSGRVM